MADPRTTRDELAELIRAEIDDWWLTDCDACDKAADAFLALPFGVRIRLAGARPINYIDLRNVESVFVEAIE